MTPLIVIVGASAEKRSAILGQVIPSLQAKGYRVGLIWRTPGLLKESALMEIGSARPDLLCTSWEKGFVLTGLEIESRPLDWCRDNFMAGMDLIFAEGWRDATTFPKIEVACKADGERLVLSDDASLFAVVADFTPDFEGSSAVPHFKFEETKELAELLEAVFLQRTAVGPQTELYVDGRPIFLTEFVQRMFSNVIASLTDLLRDVGRFKEVVVKIKK